MKKSLFLFIVFFTSMICACVENQNLADSVNVQSEDTNQAETQDKIRQTNMWSFDMDQSMAKKRDIDLAVATFIAVFSNNKQDPAWQDNKLFIDFEQVNFYQPLVDPDIKLYCFAASGVSDSYYDNTDECILLRRAKKSLISFYNYKKYLPKNSQINSEEKFLELVETYRYVYNFSVEWNVYSPTVNYQSICSQLQEKTTVEKEECEKKLQEYIVQIVEDRVPYCHNVIPKEYAQYIKDLKSKISIINNVVQDEIDNKWYLSSGEKSFGKNLYKRSFLIEMNESIKKFGYTYFCKAD